MFSSIFFFEMISFIWKSITRRLFSNPALLTTNSNRNLILLNFCFGAERWWCWRSLLAMTYGRLRRLETFRFSHSESHSPIQKLNPYSGTHQFTDLFRLVHTLIVSSILYYLSSKPMYHMKKRCYWYDLSHLGCSMHFIPWIVS